MAAPADRRRVALGGAVGTGLGVLLVALAGFFAAAPWDAPEQALGVFLPAAVAAPALALGVSGLLPLRLGDTPGAADAVARTWTAVAVLVLGLTAVGVVRAQLPWTLGGLVPAAFVVVLLRAARDVRGRAHGPDLPR